MADIIYAIHRCSHAHGDELPDGFELLSDAAGPPRLTRAIFERGKFRLSDRIIFGLLATVVFSPTNANLRAEGSYFLTFGGGERMMINDWWGRVDDFLMVAATDPVPLVRMDFTDWMT